jgi:hypothetical protein
MGHLGSRVWRVQTCPSPVSSRCCPSRQNGEVPCAAAVCRSVGSVFPSLCGQRLARGPGACGVPAVVVCPGHGTRWPSPALPAAGTRWWPAAARLRTSGVRETPRRTAVSGAAGLALRRQDRTDCVPMRLSSTVHHHTRPRRDLRGASATPASRRNGWIGRPVCAAVDGPVNAAAKTASPLHCPRLTLGCQATYQPPVGSAMRSTRRCSLPDQRVPPEGLTKEGTGAAALCPCR